MLKIKKHFLLVILCISAFGLSIVHAFTVPAHDERVTDLANIFTDSEEASLEAQLQAIETAYQAEIAVVTLPSLEWNAIEELSVQIAQERGIGKAQADNGILIVIAPVEKAWRIEVGYGLEWDLPDITAGRLGKNILVPAFQAGEYYAGVSSLVEALSGVVAGTYDPSLLEEESFADTPLKDQLLIGFMMIVFLSFFLSMFAKWISESNNKKPTPKQKQTISWRGSAATTLLWILIVGGRGLLYLLPAYLIWRMIMSSTMKGGWFNTRGWSSGGRSSGGGGWSSFGWFGGGSFGGGGAGWSW